MALRKPYLMISAWNGRAERLLRRSVERANNRRFLEIVEVVAVFVVTLIISGFFYKHGGQLIGSDMLGYVDVGFFQIQSEHLLNRYAHIYALHTLIQLAPSPLEGLRYFSAIAAGLSALLVYYSARSMSKNPQIIRGVVAILILLSFTVVVDLLQAPLADTSAMVAVLALTAVYVRSANGDHGNPWLIRLLGLMIFLAFKTKETTLVWSVALIGLGITSESRLDTRRLARNLWNIFAGILAGVVVFIVANWIFLGEPLFGLRPSDFLAYIEFWNQVATQRSEPIDILTESILPHAAIPLILYLVAGVWDRSRSIFSLQPLWLMPLALTALLAVTVNRVTAGIVLRHFLLGFALIAVLGAQVTGTRLPRLADRRMAIGLILGTLAIIGIGTLIGLNLRSTWPFPSYFRTILAPVILAVALGSMATFPTRRRMVEIPILLCILVLTIYPMRIKLPQLAMANPISMPNARFDPVLAFADELSDLESDTTFVSESMLPYLSIKSDRNELRAIFNVALDARTERDNFIIGAVESELLDHLELGRFDNVLVTSGDWEWMQTASQDQPEWRDQYSGTLEPSGQFVLLVKSDPD